MTARRRAAVVAGTAVVAGLAVARPALDVAVGRVESRLNRVTPAPPEPVSDRARALHRTLRVVDLHADSLLFGRDLTRRSGRGHVDVPRMIEGRVALQVLSMAVKTPRHLSYDSNDDRTDGVLPLAIAKRWPPSTWGRLLPRVQHLVAEARELEARSGGAFRVVTSRAGLDAYLEAHAANAATTAGLLSIEGAHALEDDPANVDVVADLGVRMISPAHFFDTAFGGSAHGVARYGLTNAGREMIARMERRGVILDVAHGSPRTIDDALAISTRPVAASHTGVRGIADNGRNLSDAQLSGIAATGGVVGIGFWETASGGTDSASIARSIAYALERIGVDHVALGSDWDGAVTVPFDAAHADRLTDALLEAGLDEAGIGAVMGENALRLIRQALPEA